MKLKRPLMVIGVALVLLGWLILTSTAGAQALPPLVTDFATYPATPQAQLPDGCDAADIVGETFALADQDPVTDVGALPDLKAGDFITMTWESAGECTGGVASLVVKDSASPTFDPNVDQPTAPNAYNVMPIGEGPGFVTLAMPDLSLSVDEDDCAYQLDAVVGVPLAKVGPTGSFYSAVTRGDTLATTLIGAKNGAYTVCEPNPVVLSVPTPPDTPVTTPDTIATTTTLPVAPVSQASTPGFANCTEAAAAGFSNIDSRDPQYRPWLDADSDGTACETSDPQRVTAPATPAGQVIVATTVPAVGSASLAATGANTVMAWAGAALLMLGLVLMLATLIGNRRQRRVVQ